MKLSPPSKLVFLVALICAVIGVLTAVNVIVVPALSGYIFWIVLGGLILLLLGNMLRGL